MLKSSGGIGAATLTSRVLGLVREQVYAAFMGTSGIYGAFVYAYMVPNLFRRLLGEGALTAAFIPVFKAKEKTEGEAAMWQATNAVLSGLVVVSAGLVLLTITVVSVLLLATSWRPERRLMLQLLRLMFPYTTLACVAAFETEMENGAQSTMAIHARSGIWFYFTANGRDARVRRQEAVRVFSNFAGSNETEPVHNVLCQRATEPTFLSRTCCCLPPSEPG